VTLVNLSKRSLAAGYAGIDNTLMLFGDAKQSDMKLLAAVQTTA